MLAGSGRRRSHPHALVGVAIYAIFLVTAPFEHHDLLCHLKTPTHCTACTSSVVGNGPNAPVAVDASALHDAGGTLAADVRTTDVLLVAESTGRSPPSLA
jgi:hypothetical protein